MAEKKSPIARSFDKVKKDINKLSRENNELNAQLQKLEIHTIGELKRENELLKENYDDKLEKLSSQVHTLKTGELSAEVKELKRELSKINYDSLREEVKSLKASVKEQQKEMKELKNSFEKVSVKDTVAKRLDELEEEIYERFDLYDRLIREKKKVDNQDDIIDKFASSNTGGDEESKKRWPFSKK